MQSVRRKRLALDHHHSVPGVDPRLQQRPSRLRLRLLIAKKSALRQSAGRLPYKILYIDKTIFATHNKTNIGTKSGSGNMPPFLRLSNAWRRKYFSSEPKKKNPHTKNKIAAANRKYELYPILKKFCPYMVMVPDSRLLSKCASMAG